MACTNRCTSASCVLHSFFTPNCCFGSSHLFVWLQAGRNPRSSAVYRLTVTLTHSCFRFCSTLLTFVRPLVLCCSLSCPLVPAELPPLASSFVCWGRVFLLSRPLLSARSFPLFFWSLLAARPLSRFRSSRLTRSFVHCLPRAFSFSHPPLL